VILSVFLQLRQQGRRSDSLFIKINKTAAASLRSEEKRGVQRPRENPNVGNESGEKGDELREATCSFPFSESHNSTLQRRLDFVLYLSV